MLLLRIALVHCPFALLPLEPFEVNRFVPANLPGAVRYQLLFDCILPLPQLVQIDDRAALQQYKVNVRLSSVRIASRGFFSGCAALLRELVRLLKRIMVVKNHHARARGEIERVYLFVKKSQNISRDAQRAASARQNRDVVAGVDEFEVRDFCDSLVPFIGFFL